MPDDGPVDALPAPQAVGKPAYRSTRTSPQARPPATRREPPAPAPPAIQTPATLPAVTAPPTEPQPPALCARRARAVTPVPPWPSPRAAQPRHPSAKSSICRSRRIPFLHAGTARSITSRLVCRWCARPANLGAPAGYSSAPAGRSCSRRAQRVDLCSAAACEGYRICAARSRSSCRSALPRRATRQADRSKSTVDLCSVQPDGVAGPGATEARAGARGVGRNAWLWVASAWKVLVQR